MISLIILQASATNPLMSIIPLVLIIMVIFGRKKLILLFADILKNMTIKRLWLLRSYVSLLNGLSEFTLFSYILISIFALFNGKNTSGISNFLLGITGSYLVGVIIMLFITAQVIQLFVNIHDNVADLRDKIIFTEESFNKSKENEEIIEEKGAGALRILLMFLSVVFVFINMGSSNRSQKNIILSNQRELGLQQETEIQNNNSNHKLSQEIVNNIIFTNPNGIKVEVYNQDLDKTDWEDAWKLTEKLGNEWRLPSIEELRILYRDYHLNKAGLFKNEVYWSGDAGAQAALLFDFSNGTELTTWDRKYAIVRPVRNVHYAAH